jgi:hypothetical protein
VPISYITQIKQKEQKMAQKEVSAHKVLGPLFSNEVGYEKLTYDFALDGGATTDTYVLATAGSKILILDACAHVETQATSGGSATVAIGIASGDVDAFLDVTSGAVANLVDDFTEKETAGQKIVVAADGKIELVIGTAALTAGKINLMVKYVAVA